MKNRRNYYRTLHVQPDAPLEIIKSSYRTLMQKLAQHPDLGGDHWNSVLINEAKEVLTDPKKRAEYDRELMRLHTLPVLSGNSYDRQRKNKKEEGGYSSPKEYTPIITSYCLFCKSPHRGNSHILAGTKCSQCQSPLYPAEKMKTEKSSQRAVNRIETHQKITFFTFWPQKTGCRGQIQDLSPNGMRFFTDQLLYKDQIVKIQSNVLQAVGRVANCRKQRSDLKEYYGIGLEFVTLQFHHSNGTFVSITA